MYAVYKYALDIGKVTIKLPEGYQILSVGVQGDGAFLWALVPVGAPPVQATFHLLMTGERLKGKPGPFLGTLLLDGGRFVLHVFGPT